jgi:N-methylhydantoinase A
MILADLVKDYSQTVMLPAGDSAPEAIGRRLRPLYRRAMDELQAEGLSSRDILLLPSLDMRYVGQSYELTIPLPGRHPGRGRARASPSPGSLRDLTEAFHEAHRLRFSYANVGEPIEIVNVRLKAVGSTAKPAFPRQPQHGPDPGPAFLGSKQVFFPSPEPPHGLQPRAAALCDRSRLTCGNRVAGPAILCQLDCTTVIPPGWAALVDEAGNLLLERCAAGGSQVSP